MKMKQFKRALLGATALTAIAGMGFAQSNDAHTFQSSNNNSLLVHQSQSGATPGDNIAGTLLEPISQHGDNNDIDILQVNNGAVGGEANVVGTDGAGVDQHGKNNKLMVSQTGADHRVYDVQQSGGAAVTSNDTSITQTGYRNAVSDIVQDFNGNAGRLGNSIVIDQDGRYNTVGDTAGHVSPGTGIIQTGNGNAANVDQNASQNRLDTLVQSGDGGGGASNIFNLTQTNNVGGQGNYVGYANQIRSGGTTPNTADITQDGQNNGYGGFVAGSAAAHASVGVSSSRMLQNGSGNDLDYVATGYENRFGFIQDGHRNVIDGRSNGTTNEMGIRQDGNDNMAVAEQQGYNHQIGVLMEGSDNKLNMYQENTGVGNGNAMLVTIDGNDNNNFPVTNPLTGDANWARNMGIGLSSFGSLNQGDLFQKGNDNSLTLNVTGNRHAFAMLQEENGPTNTINGTFTGSDNQAVVAQVSSLNTNTATFTIGGTGNILGIVQQ